MRRKRMLVHQTFPQAAYHVLSRVCLGGIVFGDEEKAKMVALMRRYERFCGMKVLTYCIMGNHFHWLVEVEEKPENADQMPDAELVEKVRRCHGKQAAWLLEVLGDRDFNIVFGLAVIFTGATGGHAQTSNVDP